MDQRTAGALLSLNWQLFTLDWQVVQDIDERLEKRLGRLHARLRLGIEADHEAQVFGQGINYFHIENLQPSHIAIRSCLKLTGLYGRGRRNATQIELRQHDVISSRIPKATTEQFEARGVGPMCVLENHQHRILALDIDL